MERLPKQSLMKILVDFHHNALLRSIVLLFEERLGMAVYRPIGLEWFHEGFWAINDQLDTAKQFLDIESNSVVDKTPPLNVISSIDNQIYDIYDPGNLSTHKAITLEAFKDMDFDYIIASIPQHIPLYERLIKQYQPQAKLIVQVGNNWSPEILRGYNVLASIKSNSLGDINAVYYHQEFDLDIFKPSPLFFERKISSYINILQNMRQGWSDFIGLEKSLDKIITFKSYGGQCRDGNKVGPDELSSSISENDFVFHVKDGGDGYGHILYNTYACGRPSIIRSSLYKDCLGEELFNSKSCIDLDRTPIEDAVVQLIEICNDRDRMNEMSFSAYETFKKNVDFAFDAEKVSNWIGNL